jgi:hypothetical protein
MKRVYVRALRENGKGDWFKKAPTSAASNMQGELFERANFVHAVTLLSRLEAFDLLILLLFLYSSV